MSINFAHAPPCGNAVSLVVMPDREIPLATAWRLLRRTDDEFVGAEDANAVIVADGDETDAMTQVLDYQGLLNGEAYWYQHYLLTDEWEASGDPVSVTPAYLAEPLYTAPDLATLVRERLALGLAAEVSAGRLRHESGAIPVLSAHPLIDAVKLPVVTVILTDRRAEVRGIGEGVLPDLFDAEQNIWSVYEGWLDRSTVQIAVWSLNHQDRLRLRDAVQRILMLNLPIFDAAGFLTPDLSEADSADFESFNAPAFQSVFTLSCLHTSLVRTKAPAIRISEVPVDAEAVYF
jgi:hypothetical protein